MADSDITRRRVPAKLVGSLVLTVLLIIFWSTNRNRVKITFFGYHSTARIWVALAISGVVGFLAGFLVAHRGRD